LSWLCFACGSVSVLVFLFLQSECVKKKKNFILHFFFVKLSLRLICIISYSPHLQLAQINPVNPLQRLSSRRTNLKNPPKSQLPRCLILQEKKSGKWDCLVWLWVFYMATRWQHTFIHQTQSWVSSSDCFMETILQKYVHFKSLICPHR